MPFINLHWVGGWPCILRAVAGWVQLGRAGPEAGLGVGRLRVFGRQASSQVRPNRRESSVGRHD
eukprot:2576269-Alexandrium_andersonii.AAC.1